MFLDESGDHNLNPKKISPNYPIFVLGGVIVDRGYLREVIEPRVREFKRRFWGREDVILHTVAMRNNAGDFHFLIDPERRGIFYAELNAMLRDLEYTVVAVVVRKDAYLARYGVEAADPYMYALGMLVERFCRELGSELDGGFICAEKRNATLDRELMATWEGLRTGGTGTGNSPSQRIDERIVGLDLRDKKPNLAAMQLADLVITPIGRYVLRMPEKTDQVQWTVVEGKLRRVGGAYQGEGLVVRP
jgi:hypothetical protein